MTANDFTVAMVFTHKNQKEDANIIMIESRVRASKIDVKLKYKAEEVHDAQARRN